MFVGQFDKSRYLGPVSREYHPFSNRAHLARIEAVAVEFFRRTQQVVIAHNGLDLRKRQRHVWKNPFICCLWRVLKYRSSKKIFENMSSPVKTFLGSSQNF